MCTHLRCCFFSLVLLWWTGSQFSHTKMWRRRWKQIAYNKSIEVTTTTEIIMEIARNIFEQRTQLFSHAKRLPSSFDLLCGSAEISKSYSPYLLFYITYCCKIQKKKEKKTYSEFFKCFHFFICVPFHSLSLFLFSSHASTTSHIFFLFIFVLSRSAAVWYLSRPHLKSSKYVPIFDKVFSKPKIGILLALKSICRFLFNITSKIGNRKITEMFKILFATIPTFMRERSKI